MDCCCIYGYQTALRLYLCLQIPVGTKDTVQLLLPCKLNPTFLRLSMAWWRQDRKTSPEPPTPDVFAGIVPEF